MRTALVYRPSLTRVRLGQAGGGERRVGRLLADFSRWRANWRRSVGRMAAMAMIGFLLAAAIGAPPVHAMSITTSGDQLILGGPVVGDELGPVTRILNSNPGITTVILRDSPGGDAPTGYRVGELFRARGLRTAVSGYCYSSCSRMFLGGKVRVFTTDYPPDVTNIGFHGHYDRGRLNAPLVQRLGLKDWIIRYSDGKADPALVERWINIPVARGMMHFYHPTRLTGHGATTFFCQGTELVAMPFGCEAEQRSALDLGVITSLEVISSNDRTEPAAPPAHP